MEQSVSPQKVNASPQKVGKAQVSSKARVSPCWVVFWDMINEMAHEIDLRDAAAAKQKEGRPC